MKKLILSLALITLSFNAFAADLVPIKGVKASEVIALMKQNFNTPNSHAGNDPDDWGQIYTSVKPIKTGTKQCGDLEVLTQVYYHDDELYGVMSYIKNTSRTSMNPDWIFACQDRIKKYVMSVFPDSLFQTKEQRDAVKWFNVKKLDGGEQFQTQDFGDIRITRGLSYDAQRLVYLSVPLKNWQALGGTANQLITAGNP